MRTNRESQFPKNFVAFLRRIIVNQTINPNVIIGTAVIKTIGIKTNKIIISSLDIFSDNVASTTDSIRRAETDSITKLKLDFAIQTDKFISSHRLKINRLSECNSRTQDQHK